MVECNLEIGDESELNNHINSRHKVTNFKCNLCGYFTISKTNYQIHLINHENQRKVFECSECEFKSNREGEVETHKYQYHSNYPMLLCSDCGNEYREEELNTHRAGQHGDKINVDSVIPATGLQLAGSIMLEEMFNLWIMKPGRHQ